MSLTVTILAAWTDSNNKKHHVVGTLQPVDTDHPDGGYLISGDIFVVSAPAGYTLPIHFDVQGFAHNDPLPGLGLTREKRYTVETRMGGDTAISGVLGAVLFFDGADELCQPPDIRAHYPADILAARWRFYAIFASPQNWGLTKP